MDEQLIGGTSHPYSQRLGSVAADGRRQFSPDARKMWFDVHGELSEPRLGVVGTALDRAEARVVRLAYP